MNSTTTPSKPLFFLRLMLALALAVSIFPLAAVPQGEAVQAAAPQVTNTLRLSVVSARTEPKAFDGAGVVAGDPVTEYKFLINVDNTGNPLDLDDPACQPFLPDGETRNPDYPALCDWPSIRTVPGWAPIFTQGDQTRLDSTTGIPLPDGKYLISVIADGYKIGGAHFTIPLADPGIVEVKLHPLPLPAATMRIKVFEDNAMTNGAFDAPIESGLEGFQAIVNDTVGQVTVDLFGNPLCTLYQKDPITGEVLLDVDGNPIIEELGAGCYSDANGDIVIPNIGPLRYDVLVVPPDGTDWTETTTLEGSWSWDTWLQEGGTGLDNEFVVAGEPFPWTMFGYVRPTNEYTPAPDTGSIKGVIMTAQVYVPYAGGLPYQGGLWGGLGGAKLDRPVDRPWIALNDLQNGDRARWIGRGNPDGSFEIPNVPPGNYMLTYWDHQLLNILDWIQVTVEPNGITDLGIQFLTSWFTQIEGYVFVDYDSDGKRDPGEPGVPDYLIVLKDRDNSEIDRMSISAVTAPDNPVSPEDESGFYVFEKAYPMSSWMILEAYNDRYYTTGVTWQASNQDEPTTVLGNGVDVGILPILGQRGRLDWGVRPYAPGTNGGIVGTVFYDSVRNELDARYAGVEATSTGIPDLTLNLYATVKNPDGSFVYEADGSYKKGALLNTTTTETYTRPKNCQARDVDGNPVDFYPLAPATGDYDCLEAPMMGLQFENGFSAIDGNYGFTEIVNNPVTGLPLPEPLPLPAGDYLVEVVIPEDSFGIPLYKVTKEEDVNVFGGDSYTPNIPPPACAGALHVVDVAGVGADGPNAVVNPSFAENGGSPYEGQLMPLCDVKMVTVTNQRSVAPSFTLFTDVPIPGKWKGYIIEDLIIETNPKKLFFGEKPGLSNIPIGLYDFDRQLVTTIHSDYHGVFEVLLPSTNTFNCPTPSGICANVYYLMGNDPGTPGKPNSLYDPNYRSIGASFEIYPGVIVPADLAPTQSRVSILTPGSQFSAVACKVDDITPQFFAVDVPYVNGSGILTIQGVAFGAEQGLNGKVTLAGIPLPVTGWSDRQIVVQVPPGTPAGAHQLLITANNGRTTINGITIHVLGAGYNPTIYEVGPGKAFDPADPLLEGRAIQSAIDAASLAGGGLVVVYPGEQVALTQPLGEYFENLVVYAPVKLQGVGPGGAYPDNTGVPGSIIDGRGVGGDTDYSEWWREFVASLAWDGNPTVYEGAVITLFGEMGEFTADFQTAIDGFIIQGGDQQGIPNLAQGQIIIVQGGGIFANAYINHLHITNNLIQSNGGAYGGAIRLGTPHLAGALNDNHNDHVVITHNRILANGGSNLAGALGIFSGADNYEVAHNDICGNFAVEYGGGISHYGYSPNGAIHHNRIYFNRSYDEGAGVMIAGELPPAPNLLSQGAGPVDVYANLIQANLANDDGGGLRFLMAGNFEYNVYNNFVVNNVSTHEGGGISLFDAPNVRIYNNTIMKNITTGTAMTSTGVAAPAGLSSARNSGLLQATLPPGSPIFSDPLIFNNLFWDNRAGTYTGTGIIGLGLEGDPSPIFRWDLGVADNTGVLTPRSSLLHVPYGVPHPSNIIGANPKVISMFDISITFQPWRGNPNFVNVDIVAVDAPVTLLGDYHLRLDSPAIDKGLESFGSVFAPLLDFDGELRPLGRGFFDVGADEVFFLNFFLPLVRH